MTRATCPNRGHIRARRSPPHRLPPTLAPCFPGPSFLPALLLVSVPGAMAERNPWKPADFEPLTSLPWKKPDATLEGVLDAIFREPDSNIRYPVLAEYLRTVSVAQLGKAFDLCIALEGTQTPDELVDLFLPIWAKRDPKACWKRTKELFRLVGIEDRHAQGSRHAPGAHLAARASVGHGAEGVTPSL